MNLETKNKNIKLVLRTRKIIDISNSLKNKNFEEALIKAYTICDLDALSKIIYSLAENEEGKPAFKNSTEVFDFIDDYRIENECTNIEIFSKVIEVMNEEGFFKKKMSKKELDELISNPISTMNMTEIIQKSTEKAVTNIVEEEAFKGYRA